LILDPHLFNFADHVFVVGKCFVESGVGQGESVRRGRLGRLAPGAARPCTSRQDDRGNRRSLPSNQPRPALNPKTGGPDVPRKRQPRRDSHPPAATGGAATDTEIRIIGGQFRGRRLRYHGDPVVRPMKHRVREAIFNLIGPGVAGRHAIDLFAGTGALGLEALSRGAAHATLIEKHVPTARVVAENIRTLGVETRTTLRVTSAFLWAKRDLFAKSQESRIKSQSSRRDLDSPHLTLDFSWLVFCSPPYAFFVERQEEMLDLIGRLREHAPPGSILVVESDERFDFGQLGEGWDVRPYPPAVVGIWRK
jgi:16S rRNA (guanine966-N2)-methyltransferase